MFKALSCSFVSLLVGCAVAVTDPAQSPDHPANAAAPEAAISAPSRTLALPHAPTSQPSDNSMQHMQGGSTQPMPTTKAAAKYTCPMHPDVISDEPGKCPKCGMTLVLKKGAQ